MLAVADVSPTSVAARSKETQLFSQAENWPVKNGALQARNVWFATDHLTSRNQKWALRKSVS